MARLAFCALLAVSAAAADAAPQTFTQLQCQDSQCDRCDQFLFNVGTCYAAQKGLYAIGTCKMGLPTPSLKQQIWSTSNCVGTPLSDTDVPLNQCLQTVDQNTWFEELCNTKTTGLASSGNGTRARAGGVMMLLPNVTALKAS